MKNLFFSGALACLLLGYAGCKHEPIKFEDVNPTGNDTTKTGGGDTTGTNPTDTTGTPCQPDIIYFEKDVLPILSSSCTMPGCHDAAAAQDGVVLTDYASIMGSNEINPGDPNDSDIYTDLFESDPDKRMPPPSSGIVLTVEQKETIRKWIQQGAQNLTCDEFAGGCNTANISYAQHVSPIILNTCVGCHNSAAPNGGVNLTSHSTIMPVVNDGRLECAISHAGGCTPMPYNQPKMDQCKIDQIVSWINAGAPNN